MAAPEPGYCASVRIAHPDEPYHTLFFHPDCGIDPEYLIAHECGHIVRLFSAPPEERKFPQSQFRDANSAFEKLGSALAQAGLPRGRRESVLHDVYLGVIRGLVSGPADIHIEEWLYRDYRSLRAQQKAGLAYGAQASAASFRRAPDLTIMLSRLDNTISYAIGQEVGQRIGEPDVAGPLADFADTKLAKKLCSIAQEIGDQGSLGDMEITDRWAKALGLEGSIRWVDAEEHS